ncbi:MAG: DUF411 domain-containing protein [Gammaproteobacteria bacterium]|nr:DUF411 domain-containing protein [Gammaproteobacteria bacterium]
MKILLSALLLFTFCLTGARAEKVPDISVYKSPTCGCCKLWIQHLRAEGFNVQAQDVEDVVASKIQAGITPRLASCHTAHVGGYVIEGHVPAADIRRLLKEKPAVTGLAVPGMPEGSPGMEGPNPVPYEVLAFVRGGPVSVFARH